MGKDEGSTGSDADHNGADVKFAQMMIPHHQQAVEMSGLVLKADGVEPDVVALAEDIKAAQAPEIELMQGWLEDWGADDGGMDGMDGMLSVDQMTALEGARGDRLVALFLEGMIGHHEGAIQMARDALDAGSSPDAQELAGQIIESQRAEIARMRDILGP
ncbi:MAG: DUF305 domain-containing protein [Nocardioidaceae bacterium]